MSTITIAGDDYPASRISELPIKETPETTDQIEIETAGGASRRIEIGRITGNAFSRIAATDLGGHRVVRLNADGQAAYADCYNLADASAVAGITIGAVILGDNAIIQTEGELIEPSWNWNIDLPVFLGALGQLTQTPPLSGFKLCVGTPLSPNRLLIRVGEAIIKAA